MYEGSLDYVRAEKCVFRAQIGQKTVKIMGLLKKWPLKSNISSISDFFQP